MERLLHRFKHFKNAVILSERQRVEGSTHFVVLCSPFRAKILRLRCAFFWGMTATGSHGIRNRWRYAQDDKVFCYLRLPDKFQFRNSLWSRGPKDVGWPPSVRDALAAGPARQIPICLTVEAFGQYSCILHPGGKQARERHTQTQKLVHWGVFL